VNTDVFFGGGVRRREEGVNNGERRGLGERGRVDGKGQRVKGEKGPNSIKVG
jgi:hypothetical protein